MHALRQHRLLYFACVLVTIALGLASRRYKALLPAFLAAYAGDTIWGLMVFFAVSYLTPQLTSAARAGLAFTFACAVEASQLYHAPWIDSIRQTTIGGLVLGFTFVWSDLACYGVGIVFGFLLDTLVLRRNSAKDRAGASSEAPG